MLKRMAEKVMLLDPVRTTLTFDAGIGFYRELEDMSALLIDGNYEMTLKGDLKPGDILEAVNHPDFVTGYEKIHKRTSTLGRNDVDALYGVTTNPLVMDNYVDAKGVRVFDPPYEDVSRETKWGWDKTLKFIEGNMESWAAHGYGRWGMVLRDTRELIGYCGLAALDYMPPQQDFVPEDRPIELSFRLHPTHWQKGLAREAARATFVWGFEEFGLENIYASAVTTNRESRTALTKLGMAEIGSFPYVSDSSGRAAEFVVHRITRAEWAAIQY